MTTPASPHPAGAAAVATVAIVGAGFSGTLLAVHLLRAARTPLHVVLIERSGRPGRGLAYASPNASHLLNVRVANMSALPEQPAHFRDWLRTQGLAAGLPDGGAPAFVPRQVYGTYLEALLADAQASAADGVRCTCLGTAVTAIGADGAGWRLQLTDGTTLAAAQAVLCLGNFPPAPPCALPDELPAGCYVADPWDAAALAAVPSAATVLIAGTGLTMVDVLLSLLDRGHRGPVVAVSRRGLLPQAHAAVAAPWPCVPDDAGFGRLRALLAAVRAGVRTAGGDWRAVIDGLRPHTQRLWAALPAAERRRFLRHLRPYWEVHRHRLAPPVAARLHAALAGGQLRVIPARLHGIRASADGRLHARGRWRGGSDTFALDADVLINCTGPQCDYARIADPLLRDALDRGLLRADALGLGLDADEDGGLLDAAGRPQPGLYGLGPLVRGRVWELTAVPELRFAAAGLGVRIAAELASTGC